MSVNANSIDHLRECPSLCLEVLHFYNSVSGNVPTVSLETFNVLLKKRDSFPEINNAGTWLKSVKNRKNS